MVWKASSDNICVQTFHQMLQRRLRDCLKKYGYTCGYVENVCVHTLQKVMEAEYCPREDIVMDIHATEDQLPNLSLSNPWRGVGSCREELIACIEFRVCSVSTTA